MTRRKIDNSDKEEEWQSDRMCFRGARSQKEGNRWRESSHEEKEALSHACERNNQSGGAGETVPPGIQPPVRGGGRTVQTEQLGEDPALWRTKDRRECGSFWEMC